MQPTPLKPMKRLHIISLVLFSVTVPRLARADTGSRDEKEHYTLFNPTPRLEMREWRTDHAGVSPYTVDAGHFEVQVTGLSYGYQGNHSSSQFAPAETANTEAWAFGETVVKAGLLNNLDL